MMDEAFEMAHALKSPMGWGSREPPNQQMRLERHKGRLKAGSSLPQ